MSQYIGSFVLDNDRIVVLLKYYHAGEMVYEDNKGHQWTEAYLLKKGLLVSKNTLVKILFGAE